MVNGQCVSHRCTRKTSTDACDESSGCILDSNLQCIRNPCYVTSQPTSVSDCPAECEFVSGCMNVYLLYHITNFNLNV
jgi:hypothetical protein